MDQSTNVTLAHTERHLLESRHVGSNLQLWIGHPVSGWRGPAKEPTWVLYVLDGDLFFGTAVEMTRLMHQLYGELPPILVVGVAYGTTDPATQAQLRNRDLTPSPDRSFQRFVQPQSAQSEIHPPEGQPLGKAAPFLAFLLNEAKPFVERRYDLEDATSLLFGSSLGGLFTLWTFLNDPASFSGFVAASPALWWNDEMLFDVEERCFQKTKDVDAALYLAVGELEEDPRIPHLADFKLVSNVRRMGDVLAGRSYPSLRCAVEVIPGESHTSVVPAALTRGVRWITRGRRPSTLRDQSPRPSRTDHRDKNAM